SMKGKSIRSIQINYLAGIPVGEEIHLVRFDNSNHHAYVFGVNAKDPTRVHFQARIGIAD
ncbi:MAG: acyl-ACP thioesterase, partial [Fibrobacter sp.]|nr:acyl-ACP thioesterase [Fibrobacter sp.]